MSKIRKYVKSNDRTVIKHVICPDCKGSGKVWVYDDETGGGRYDQCSKCDSFGILYIQKIITYHRINGEFKPK